MHTLRLYIMRGVGKGDREVGRPPPPHLFLFGRGGGKFYTFPIYSVRAEISAKRTILKVNI